MPWAVSLLRHRYGAVNQKNAVPRQTGLEATPWPANIRQQVNEGIFVKHEIDGKVPAAGVIFIAPTSDLF